MGLRECVTIGLTAGSGAGTSVKALAIQNLGSQKGRSALWESDSMTEYCAY